MPMPTEVNFTIYDWSTETHRFNVKDNAGNARSLTGYTAVCQVRDVHGGTLLLSLTEGAGCTTSGSGFVDVEFDGAVIGPAVWETAVYDVFVVRTADGERFAIATGAISVAQSVASFA